MGTLLLWMILLAPYGTICAETQTEYNTSNRLSNIEAVLKTVIAKNAELEKRIEVLEDENQRLKAAVIISDKLAPSDDEEPARATQRDYDVNDDAESQITGKNVIRRKTDKVPRLVSAGEQTVGFTAVLTQYKISNLGRGQTIKYDNVITNEGGGYHIHTGVFIAPIGGVYVFTFDIMMEPGDSEQLIIMCDGNAIASGYAHGHGASLHITTSRTYVLRINQGSEVWIQTGDGDGTVHGKGYSSFSGWLISP